MAIRLGSTSQALAKAKQSPKLAIRPNCRKPRKRVNASTPNAAAVVAAADAQARLVRELTVASAWWSVRPATRSSW